MGRLKSYLAVARGEVLSSLTYRAFSYASIVVSLMQIGIFYFIWTGVYQDRESIRGYGYEDMISYIVVGRILIAMFNWGLNGYISRLIRTGNIIVQLLYPLGFMGRLFFMGIGSNLFINFFFTALPVYVFSVFAFGVRVDYKLSNMVFFFISLFLGFVIMFLFDFLMGSLNFWTENSWGIQTIKSSFLRFFSGSLVPLEFFPDVLRNLADILPFKSVVYIPANIFLGRMDTALILHSFAVQAAWIIAFFIISRLVYASGIKRINIYGG